MTRSTYPPAPPLRDRIKLDSNILVEADHAAKRAGMDRESFVNEAVEQYVRLLDRAHKQMNYNGSKRAKIVFEYEVE